MAEENKSGFFNNAWIKLLITYLVLSPLGKLLGDKYANIPVLSTFLKVTSFVWVSILNFQIPVWIIIILLIVIYFAVRISKISEPSTPTRFLPEWLKWKEGVIKSWNWSWDYNLDAFRKSYTITNLRVICDKCGFKMNDSYRCPNCNNQIYNRTENEHDIIDIIQQRINRDDYPKL